MKCEILFQMLTNQSIKLFNSVHSGIDVGIGLGRRFLSSRQDFVWVEQYGMFLVLHFGLGSLVSELASVLVEILVNFGKQAELMVSSSFFVVE